nr:MAG TPA: hypothetical protein [Caudoviricetes sp.]DAI22799.1 MAG TPA: hypothetical protein [Caudoviricetes sp.]
MGRRDSTNELRHINMPHPILPSRRNIGITPTQALQPSQS